MGGAASTRTILQKVLEIFQAIGPYLVIRFFGLDQSKNIVGEDIRVSIGASKQRSADVAAQHGRISGDGGEPAQMDSHIFQAVDSPGFQFRRLRIIKKHDCGGNGWPEREGGEEEVGWRRESRT
jgi:hypothetical protein